MNTHRASPPLAWAAMLVAAAGVSAQQSETPGPAAAGIDWRGNQDCEVCHLDSKYTHRYPQIEIGSADIDKTVHAKFACVDCHYVGYDDYPHDKITHRVDCAECHDQQREEYHRSEHYKARLEGNIEAPTCTDCHGFHDIQTPAAQLAGRAAIETCARCHADEALTSKFKLKSDVLQGFSTTYHGQMYRLGFEGDDYATCVSCHDNHAIMGKDNPDSTIAAANIVKTCAQCHDDANQQFAGFLTHWTPGDGQSRALDRVFRAANILLWSVMIAFGLNAALWFLHSLLTQGHAIQFKPSDPELAAEKVVRRFTPGERIMHLVLALSFLTLAFTGLPVKFSDAAISQWIAQHLIGFHAAATLHRVAGITLIALWAIHVVYIGFRALIKRERGMFWGPTSMMPMPRDIKDFVNHVLYFLFLRKSPPKFDRWTYWEKFDYFAVFWGMVIIGSSGLSLMLPLGITKVLPGWTLNLAHIVHSEEALLATGFIFVIHFFNTHLRPHAFPLDDVIFTGQVTLDRLEQERPAEYQRLVSGGGLQAVLTDPMPVWKVMACRFGGLVLLLVGVALLVVILFGVGH